MDTQTFDRTLNIPSSVSTATVLPRSIRFAANRFRCRQTPLRPNYIKPTILIIHAPLNISHFIQHISHATSNICQSGQLFNSNSFKMNIFRNILISYLFMFVGAAWRLLIGNSSAVAGAGQVGQHSFSTFRISGYTSEQHHPETDQDPREVWLGGTAWIEEGLSQQQVHHLQRRITGGLLLAQIVRLQTLDHIS